MPPRIYDAKYWLDRAQEALIQAEQMVTPEARDGMIEIAARYRRLAQHVQERTWRKKPRPQ